MSTNTFSRIAAKGGAGAVIAFALAVSACGIDRHPAPDLAGPSGHALSLSLAATPDALPRDGSSQATITVVARDQVGEPVPGLRLIVGVSPEATVASPADIVTDSAGRAAFAVTAPPGSTVAQGNQIAVFVDTVGENAANVRSGSVFIRLLGPSNTTRPTASFTFTPEAPAAGQTIVFDGSATTDEGVACTTCTFTWNFGDGSDATTDGVATHQFAVGTFAVTLTVTDVNGSVGSATQVVSVVP